MWTNRRLVVASVGVISAGVLASWWYRTRSRTRKARAAAVAAAAAPQSRTVNYAILVKALNLSNPQIEVVLQYIVEKSPFKEHQVELEKTGCLTRIGELLFSTTIPGVRTLCYKVFNNISTNPDLLRHVKPIIPFLYEELLKEDEAYLPQILSLLVNLTSHHDVIVPAFNLRPVPHILSRYTPQINYQYEIVLSSLKILINMTCANIKFDLSLVYMSLIHLLHGCKNNTVLLRVLTLLRNVLNSPSFKHDRAFNDDLLRGVATVISSNRDEECLALAHDAFKLLSE